MVCDLYIIYILFVCNLYGYIQEKRVVECLDCPKPQCYKIAIIHQQRIAFSINRNELRRHNEIHHPTVADYCLLSVVYTSFISHLHLIYILYMCKFYKNIIKRSNR